DVKALCDARDTLRAGLAAACRDGWQARYQANRPAGQFDPAAPATARRSLAHAALALLAPALDGAAAEAILGDHYRRADNLTDRQVALAELTRHPAVDGEVRERLLEDFYQRWQREALVVNLWFSLQAASPLCGADGIRALSRHAAFDPRNPNKLRALYGVFSRQNHRRFHEGDGSGYALLGDTVLELDERNP